jgi:hypothetical protein
VDKFFERKICRFINSNVLGFKHWACKAEFDPENKIEENKNIGTLVQEQTLESASARFITHFSSSKLLSSQEKLDK